MFNKPARVLVPTLAPFLLIHKFDKEWGSVYISESKLLNMSQYESMLTMSLE